MSRVEFTHPCFRLYKSHQKAGLANMIHEMTTQGITVISFDETTFYSTNFKHKAVGNLEMIPL